MTDQLNGRIPLLFRVCRFGRPALRAGRPKRQTRSGREARFSCQSSLHGGKPRGGVHGLRNQENGNCARNVVNVRREPIPMPQLP